MRLLLILLAVPVISPDWFYMFKTGFMFDVIFEYNRIEQSSCVPEPQPAPEEEDSGYFDWWDTEVCTQI